MYTGDGYEKDRMYYFPHNERSERRSGTTCSAEKVECFPVGRRYYHRMAQGEMPRVFQQQRIITNPPCGFPQGGYLFFIFCLQFAKVSLYAHYPERHFTGIM